MTEYETDGETYFTGFHELEEQSEPQDPTEKETVVDLFSDEITALVEYYADEWEARMVMMNVCSGRSDWHYLHAVQHRFGHFVEAGHIGDSEAQKILDVAFAKYNGAVQNVVDSMKSENLAPTDIACELDERCPLSSRVPTTPWLQRTLAQDELEPCLVAINAEEAAWLMRRWLIVRLSYNLMPDELPGFSAQDIRQGIEARIRALKSVAAKKSVAANSLEFGPSMLYEVRQCLAADLARKSQLENTQPTDGRAGRLMA